MTTNVKAAATWISSLNDPVLKAAFTAFGDSITEADMAKALDDLASELTSDNTTLSASQLTDLETIAANIGSMGASSYLQFITDAFVNGDAANADWTGGAASATPLGDLATGYTVTQLNELIGKWFLGTDLPSDGGVYTLSSAPLYGPGGPTAADVNQGSLADCYLLASLAEVAAQDPSAIESMITNNGNGTYGVGFTVYGQKRFVTVNADLQSVGNHTPANADWATLVEKAYAEVQAQGLITGNMTGEGNSFATIGNTGSIEYALEEITGATAITDFSGATGAWARYVYNQYFDVTAYTGGLSASSVLSTLAADLLVGDDLVLDSLTNATDSSGRVTLVAAHAMSIYGYDASTGLVEIRNPWGGPTNASYDVTFEVSLNALLSDRDTITTDNVGTATSVSGASVVAASALQTMAQVTAFTVTDTVANVDAVLSGLIADTKLNSVTINGTTGADSLTLTGLAAAATINMDGDSDKAAVAGFASTGSGAGKATSLALGSSYDAIALGAGAATIDFALGSTVEDVTAFSSAHDLLSITLNGASLEQTLVNGGDWLSSSSDFTHGAFLAGVSSLQRATVNGGIATVA